MRVRVSGGRERGRKLKSARGTGLRPTSERVRAAIFSIIGQDALQDARVLDLYAGTGALGIEALSRGASWADFVEVDPRRCRAIRESMNEMGLRGKGHVYCAKAEKALRKMKGEYDLVLADPPYNLDPWDILTAQLETTHLLKENSLMIIEHHEKRSLAERYGRLVQMTSRRHGDTSISIYQARAYHG